jgi:hypothetical protein
MLKRKRQWITVGSGSWWFDVPQLEDLPDEVLVHIFELAFPSIALLTTMLLVQKSWVVCLRMCQMPGAMDHKEGRYARERVTDAVLGTTVLMFPSLEALDLSDCAKITDDGLLMVPNLAGLKNLTLSCNQVTDVGLGMALSSLPVLEELDVSRCSHLSVAVLRYFSVLPHLHRLRCGINDDLDDEMLRILGGLTQLRTLVLVSCESVTDVGVGTLSALTRLRELRLSGASQVTHTGLLALSGHTPLEVLHLDGLASMHCATDMGIQMLQSFPHLQALRINHTYGVDFPERAMRSLINHNVLQELNLGGNAFVSDDTIFSLFLLKDLRKLTLFRCSRVSDLGLQTLARFPLLECLDLEGCYAITDTGVLHLSVMTGLLRLCLSFVGNITDVGLSALSHMSSLQCLTLNGCEGFTDRGLQCLYIIDCAEVLRFRMSSLENLQVQRCPLLTYSLVLSMRLMRPGCNLEFYSKWQISQLTDTQSHQPNPLWGRT